MSIITLPKMNGLFYEVNMDESYYEQDSIDEWGAAIVMDGNKRGCEYNYCYLNGNEQSAIYKMDGIDTDENTYTHYEIDFGVDNWKEKLIEAMIEAYHEFWDREE
jgi:hypothetical protein